MKIKYWSQYVARQQHLPMSETTLEFLQPGGTNVPNDSKKSSDKLRQRDSVWHLSEITLNYQSSYDPTGPSHWCADDVKTVWIRLIKPKMSWKYTYITAKGIAITHIETKVSWRTLFRNDVTEKCHEHRPKLRLNFPLHVCPQWP